MQDEAGGGRDADAVAAGGTTVSATALSEKPGDKIGPYKLLQQIGEGGCGVVYMAEQQEPIRRRVALKVIKLGMDTKQVIARFEVERQALALMDHPSIARVLDAGTTETGRPYFVMELVRGIKITEYCDENNLATEQRLDLFMQVCHAIQHAHQKGIIHRDIKPSNILVTVVDGRPVPKVIDFGIAKAIGQQLTDKTLFTAFEQFIGTLAYMSPEQAQLSGVDVDTRSDIYSLGVLLYELLTGHTPFDPKTLVAAGLDEMRRLIREKEPPRPSTRISTLDVAERTTVAKHRQAEPAALRRLVRGDLDWIVMKCLEKDRGRRYETANNVAVDIVHHLQHRPVSAAAPGTFYRAEKFIRRHKAGLAVAGALVLLLAAGVVVSTWQAVRATQAEREQTRLRQAAEARAYASDMSLAGHSASSGANLGSVQHLLSRWQQSKPDRRGWEWYYLNGLCHRDLLTINADTNGVMCVAWSPDGERLASAGRDSTVRIWDASTGRKITELHGHADTVHTVAWSPDGTRLATASEDSTVRVWDAVTSTAVLTLTGHSDAVFGVAWSRDGKKLASTSQDGIVKIWDPATGAEVLTVPLPPERLYVRSWNVDGTRLAVFAGDTARVLDTLTGRTLLTLDYGANATWSPDGKWLATGGADSLVRIFDAATGTNVAIVGLHEHSVMCVAWSPDGTRLASSSAAQGSVKVWDPYRDAKPQTFRGHAGIARVVSWCPDGKRIASAGIDGTVKVWGVNSVDPSLSVKTQPGQVMSLAWHPDGKRLASSASDGSVRIWDTASAREPIVLHGHTNWVWQVVWNPAGTRLASGGSGGLLKVWEATNGGELWGVQASTGLRRARRDVRSLAWSPNGKRLASVAQDGYLKIWDAGTGALLGAFDFHGMELFALAWSPDSRQLANGLGSGSIGEIRILDAATGTLQHTLRGHRATIRSLAWSRDGKRLASACDDTTAKVWDTETGREIHTLIGHSSQVRSVAWSPDETRLASGGVDGTVRIWDPATGEQVCLLTEQPMRESWVFAVAWSPDGTRIASSDIRGTILIHDATPGRAAEEKRKRGEQERAEFLKQPAKPRR